MYFLRQLRPSETRRTVRLHTYAFLLHRGLPTLYHIYVLLHLLLSSQLLGIHPLPTWTTSSFHVVLRDGWTSVDLYARLIHLVSLYPILWLLGGGIDAVYRSLVSALLLPPLAFYLFTQPVPLPFRWDIRYRLPISLDVRLLGNLDLLKLRRSIRYKPFPYRQYMIRRRL